MNNMLTNSVMFIAGVAIGSAVTWKLIKDRYEKITREEINSVKEVFSKLKNESNNDCQPVEEEVGLDDYKGELKKHGYSNDENADLDEPYVITPEEFGELEDYRTISLTYYNDGFVTDEMDEVIDDVDDIVGLDSLDTFGQYEDDSVFVRNDRLMCDFEILKDDRNFRDVFPDR